MLLPEEARRAPKDKKEDENKGELDLAAWLVAWDRYSLAAAMTGQLSFASAQLHKDVVVKLACRACRQKRSTLVGVMYDNLVRCVALVFSELPVLAFSCCVGWLCSGSIGRKKAAS